MNTIWLIASKDLRQRLRDRSAYLLALALPLALAVIYSLIFGSGAAPRPFRYAVADLDGGQVAQSFAGQMLPHIAAEGIIELRQVTSRDQALAAARDGDVDAAFVIPQGFPQNGAIEVIGNPEAPTGTDVAVALARSFTAELESIRLSVAAASPSQLDAAELAAKAMQTARPLTVEDVSARERVLGTKSYFAAAMAVFFLFFTVQYGVTSILDERQQGTLNRLLAAATSPRQVLAGKLLSSFILGVASMTMLVVATRLLLGAQWGNPIGVMLLVVCGVTAATGITALVAALAKTPELAGSMQAVIAVVLGLLGGAFFPIAQLGGFMRLLSLLTPHAWFLRGLGDLAGGGSVSDVLPAAGAMLAFAAATLAVALTRLGKLVQP
jgi:ABC-2 type transport system permease protein